MSTTVPHQLVLWLDSVLVHASPATVYLVENLPYTPVRVRKALLTCTRVQSYPIPGSRLYERLHGDLQVTFSVGPTRQNAYMPTVRNGWDLLKLVESVLSSPVMAGLISMLLREYPYADYSDVEQVKKDTISKELQAALNVHDNASLNYTSILSFSGSLSQRLYWNLPMSEVQNLVYMGFHFAQVRLKSQTFFPNYKRKTIGRIAMQTAREVMDTLSYVPQEWPLTIQDVERFYFETGIKLSGPTEVRCAWKYNDLKPRVYYARGPTAYWDSRYIQAVFNTLVDQFPCTNRFTRFSTQSLPEMTASDILFIYDYASFTSSLPEVRRFTEALAEFYSDVTIRLCDPRDGYYSANLGDLLKQYNQTCNVDAEFDASPVLDAVEVAIMHHNTGMLGVPGNISSCTLLHGLHLAILLSSLQRGKSVGDDAIGIRSVLNLSADELHSGICNLGNVAVEKTESWSWDADPDMSEWHYTKRPITRVDTRVVTGWITVWPSLANIFNFQDEYHVPSASDPSERARKFVTQYIRLLDVLDLRVDHYFPEESEVLYALAKKAYEIFGLPRGGQVCARVDASEFRPYAIPPLYRIGVDKEPWRDRLRRTAYEHPLSVPRVSYDRLPFRWDMLLREQVATMSREVKLMCDMGVVENCGLVTDERRLFFPQDAWLVEALLYSQFDPVYRLVLLCSPPSWLTDSTDADVD